MTGVAEKMAGGSDAARLGAAAGELRVVISRLSRRLREESHLGDFTWSQVKVIQRLDRDGPATVTALAQAEGIRPQSMGATIAVLREAGLVEGTPDPNDGRQTVLSLTQKCREAVASGRAAKQDWLVRAIASRLAPAEQARLADAVGLLERLLDS
jgi:DNA-binding MarR family transcriptional regulator